MFLGRLRLLLVGVVFLIPLTAYLSRPVVQNRVGLIAGAAGVVLSLALAFLAQRGWIPGRSATSAA